MSPGFNMEYSREPHPLSPKEASINGMDQQQHRSSLNSPDGISTKKTATLRTKLEGELNFQNRGKSLTHSPSPGPTVVRRRTASTDQAISDSKGDHPPPPLQPLPSQAPQASNIPAAPPFTPPVSKVSKEDKKPAKQNAVKVDIIEMCIRQSMK